MRVAADGLFLGKEINGVPRYAREIVQGLDELGESGEFTLLMPGRCTVKHPLHLKNISQKQLDEKAASYEDFGFPPLEALARGTRVVVLNSSSLPEMFGGNAH